MQHSTTRSELNITLPRVSNFDIKQKKAWNIGFIILYIIIYIILYTLYATNIKQDLGR